MIDAHQLMPMESKWDWQYDGLCRTVNPELFYHPENERGPARQRREDRAKQICFQCPVLQQCRDHALSTREPFGVWGGMSETQRETASLNNSHDGP